MEVKDRLSRSFDWLNVTQFLGALNDNIFQSLMIFFIIGLVGNAKAPNVNAIAGIVFVVPFLLLTPYAGVLADRYSKRNIIVMTKIAELIIMLLGWLIFAFGVKLGDSAAIWGIYLILFLMCTQSTFFGPCKYGIIPEFVKKDQLSRANSFLEGLTYLSIVLGSAAAPFLASVTGERFAVAGLACIAVAVVGVISSFRIGQTVPLGKPSRASLVFVKDIWRTYQNIKHDKELVLIMIASAYFMLLGGFAKVNMIPFGIEVCGATAIQSGYLFVVAAVGIGIGSFLAGKLSKHSIEFGIVPIGAIGMAISAIGLGLVPRQTVAPTGLWEMIRLNPGVFGLIVLFGISAGLYIVPVHAFIQLRAPEKIRGQVVAASNFLGWIGVALASGLIYVVCGLMGVSSQWMFVILGLLTIVLAVLTVWKLPDFLMRLVLVMLTRTCYRIRCHGLENVPDQGPALLVSNHVSWADAVILMATQPRRIRFVMSKEIYQKARGFQWLLKMGQVILVSPTDPPRQIVESLQTARHALDDGHLVGIFAEGAVTRNGNLGRFHSGFEKIIRGTNHPIIPVYLGGMWGSVLSYYHGPVLSQWPNRFPWPVSVHFGQVMSSESSTDLIRLKIEELSCDYFDSQKPRRLTLGETFIQSARKHRFQHCMADTTGKRLTYGKALIAAIAFADKIRPQVHDQQNIGIFLPPTVAAALSNLAIALLNKTAVNMSYTASESDREYIMTQAEIKTVVTSRSFLEKVNVPEISFPSVVFVEDLAASVTGGEKAAALVKSWLMPRQCLAHARSAKADDTALILFTSGSSGRPKGVLLSHHNILSNIEGALMVFRVYKNDNLCSLLPMFHSFGLNCTFWLPLVAGIGVSFVPNPLDGKLVGQTIHDEKCTLLFTTPTFLLNYLRRCEPEDLKTLRFVVTGAEKLKPKLIDAFEKRFGVRPREGYGATELSPLAGMNIPDVEVAGDKQVGTKEGTIGHPLPGLAVKVVNPQTGEVLSIGEEGLLWIKGPNVMKGYLNLPEKTAQVLDDGWYNTGDIVTIDEDGFITITDRLSRFSKIGGEMVPHMTIEETCMKLLNTAENVVAITSLPDDKKGEQLVLVYVQDAVNPEELFEKLAESDLPKLYIPKRENLVGVEEIPHLGSGKLDIMNLRNLAKEKLQKTE